MIKCLAKCPRNYFWRQGNRNFAEKYKASLELKQALYHQDINCLTDYYYQHHKTMKEKDIILLLRGIKKVLGFSLGEDERESNERPESHESHESTESLKSYENPEGGPVSYGKKVEEIVEDLGVYFSKGLVSPSNFQEFFGLMIRLSNTSLPDSYDFDELVTLESNYTILQWLIIGGALTNRRSLKHDKQERIYASVLRIRLNDQEVAPYLNGATIESAIRISSFFRKYEDYTNFNHEIALALPSITMDSGSLSQIVHQIMRFGISDQKRITPQIMGLLMSTLNFPMHSWNFKFTAANNFENFTFSMMLTVLDGYVRSGLQTNMAVEFTWNAIFFIPIIMEKIKGICLDPHILSLYAKTLIRTRTGDPDTYEELLLSALPYLQALYIPELPAIFIGLADSGLKNPIIYEKCAEIFEKTALGWIKDSFSLEGIQISSDNPSMVYCSYQKEIITVDKFRPRLPVPTDKYSLAEFHMRVLCESVEYLWSYIIFSYINGETKRLEKNISLIANIADFLNHKIRGIIKQKDEYTYRMMMLAGQINCIVYLLFPTSKIHLSIESLSLPKVEPGKETANFEVYMNFLQAYPHVFDTCKFFEGLYVCGRTKKDGKIILYNHISNICWDTQSEGNSYGMQKVLLDALHQEYLEFNPDDIELLEANNPEIREAACDNFREFFRDYLPK